MASVAFEAFLPEVLLEAPGVPNPVAINAIRNACFDFCRDSLWLTQLGSDTAYTTGTQDYTLVPPADTRVVGVLSVVLDNDRAIYPWSMEETVVARPGWQTETGPIAGYVQQSPSTMSMVPIPTQDGTYKPLLAIAPSRTATTVDDRLYDYHLESIKYGALWKLKSMVGQAWADPTGASLYEQRFLMMVNQATIERLRSNSRASMRVAPRPFV
jgi:hypothetical protein